MERRQFLVVMSGLCAAWATRSFAAPSPGAQLVTIVQFDDYGHPLGRITVPKVHNDAEWKKRLSPLAYWVTAEGGTERAFSIPGYDRHEPGLYRCVRCGNALFDAAAKYDSHTGWPSFWQPIAPENIRTAVDRSLGMTRIEVRCTLCDSHLGHVFEDGPPPTGLRYCINTVALRFVPHKKS